MKAMKIEIKKPKTEDMEKEGVMKGVAKIAEEDIILTIFM